MAGATERLPEHLLSSSHPSKRPTGSQKITLLRGSPPGTQHPRRQETVLYFSRWSPFHRWRTASIETPLPLLSWFVCLTLPPSLPSVCVIPARARNGPEGQTHAPSLGLDGPEILTLPGSPQSSPALSKITKLPVPHCRSPAA